MSEHKHYLSDIISDMNEKLEKATAKLKITGIRRLTLVGVLILVIVAVVLIGQAVAPKRSVDEYCKVYKEEKSRLALLPGDTYPSLLFDHPQNNAGEFANSLNRLEKTAPEQIDSDIKTLSSLYTKLSRDPSQMVSISLAAESVDKSLSDWTIANCK